MKRTKLPADRAVGTSTDRRRQWRLQAVALAAAALLSLPSPPAQALALGRVTVQSALGEPLRADIELPEITPDEVASLRATVASPAAFRAAGLEYNPALTNVQITLQRRPDGRHFLRLTSDRPINEPFVDLVLETTWSSGRIVRDFTMLFDPPALRQGQQPLTAQVSPGQPSTSAVSTPVTPRSRTAAAPAPAAPQATTPRTPATAPAQPSGNGQQVAVQAGDTAGKIAATHKAESVSLDQMLVALLRANPDAFVDGNVNRLRAGAVLTLPTAEEAQSVSTTEARQTLVAQSRDFNEFRRRLAEGLPATVAPATSQREARGQIQAQVEEKRPAAATPDKLTLSKGGVQAKAGTEERIARERASQDAATRVAELNRNLSELSRLSSATPGGTATGPGAAAPAPGGPTLAVPGAATTPAAAASKPSTAPATASAAAPASAPVANAAASAPQSVAAASAPLASAQGAASAPAAAAASAPMVAATSAPSAGASAPEAAATPAAPASAPVAAAPAAAPAQRPAPPPLPVEEPSLLDSLLENPLIPAAAGGALLLLLGAGAWRIRQRRHAAQVDSSFLESRLQPDSFFGASGGQRVDTAEGTPTGSSMVYSPSQLDAAGDVDPVAEADVYLAYGRDLQAEEILKEALRINPQRVAIHAKLLEIYAKRRDARAFEQVASEAYSLTRGEGPEWARICELGQELDPANPMYQPGGQPADTPPVAPVAVAAAAPAAVAAFASTSKMSPVEAPAPAGAPGVDLDLDFSLGDDEPAAAAAPALDPDATLLAGSLGGSSAPAMPSLHMDFAAAQPPAASAQLDAPDLALDANSLNFSPQTIDLTTPPAPAPAQAAAPAPAADAGMIEFDLGSLSLDLGSSTAAPAPAASAGGDTESPSTAGLELGAGDDGENPLATKLALAEEFNAIGDADGARSLAQEVIAEASGDLKNRAQKFLAEIS